MAYYDSAAAAHSEIAAHAGGDQNRLSYAERGERLFERWSLAWLALSDEVGPEQSALAALAAVERGLAQALLSLMRRTAADGQGGGNGAGDAAVAPGADMAAEGERLARHISRSGSSALYYVVTSDTLLIWLVGPSGVEVFRRDVSEQALAEDVAALRRGLGADSAAVRARLALRDVADLEASADDVGIGIGFAAAARRLSAQATEELMRRFYTHWLDGSSKAEALRRAQAELRAERGSRFHDPRYWAAFQLVGAR